MQTVLLDPTRRSTAGRTFATQSPPLLIHGDVVTPTMFGATEFKRGCHTGTTATNNGNLYRFVSRQAVYPVVLMFQTANEVLPAYPLLAMPVSTHISAATVC
jgi:uncharacterized protein YigE (DUF2233 family)